MNNNFNNTCIIVMISDVTKSRLKHHGVAQEKNKRTQKKLELWLKRK